MLNKVQIIGRLGRDVEIRTTQAGQAIASFTVATDESYTQRDGQRVEQTEWHRISCFGKTAELCGRFIGKGSLVYVEGRIRTRKYQDRDGQERSVTEVTADRVLFLDKRQEKPEAWATAPYKPAPAPEKVRPEDVMQDIPF